MPVITVELGKLTTEQKRELIKVFTEKLTEITNVPGKFTSVIIKENEDQNLGVAGETVADLKEKMKNSK
jgi:4-oxalocrotonate tautomerase